MWSRKHDRCQQCGTAEIKHVARGLCVKCYNKDIQKRHTGNNKWDGEGLFKLERQGILTKNRLHEEYINKHKSIGDIAREYGCTRQNVYQHLKKHDIPIRPRKDSRKLALDKGKVKFTRNLPSGEEKTITLEKRHINENFFKEWSAPMAWVLGLIFTDGNLSLKPTGGANAKWKARVKTLQFSQKEPEIIEKMLHHMDCNAKITKRKRRVSKSGVVAGEVYTFSVYNEQIYDSLVTHGVTPRKSMTIQFPDVPEPYMRHFIRGCWDGDGSISFPKKGNHRASIVSGSLPFLEGMMDSLVSAGQKRERIYNRNEGRHHWFVFIGKKCANLFEYFYHDVSDSMYMERKYELFKRAYELWKDQTIPLDFTGSENRT